MKKQWLSVLFIIAFTLASVGCGSFRPDPAKGRRIVLKPFQTGTNIRQVRTVSTRKGSRPPRREVARKRPKPKPEAEERAPREEEDPIVREGFR
ncbi:MAG: hypothetical protein ABR589_12205 [Chthoniobacterales bacterium]